MAANDDETLDAGGQPETRESRKKRNNVYSRSSRLAYYIGIISLESVIVGIANIASSLNYPWRAGLNLIGGILAVICCLFPVFAVRAITKTPPGPKMKSFLGVMGVVQVPLCVISVIVLGVFIVMTMVDGYMICKKRDEYDPDLSENRCTPNLKNLSQLSILDTVVLSCLMVLLMLRTSQSFRNKEVFKLRRPN